MDKREILLDFVKASRAVSELTNKADNVLPGIIETMEDEVYCEMFMWGDRVVYRLLEDNDLVIEEFFESVHNTDELAEAVVDKALGGLIE